LETFPRDVSIPDLSHTLNGPVEHVTTFLTGKIRSFVLVSSCTQDGILAVASSRQTGGGKWFDAPSTATEEDQATDDRAG
jgi:hypothetical protein